jgi:hypothetical protein
VLRPILDGAYSAIVKVRDAVHDIRGNEATNTTSRRPRRLRLREFVTSIVVIGVDTEERAR